MCGNSSSCLITPLSDELNRSTLVLAVFLGNSGKWDGPARHRWIARWLAGGLEEEEELWSWLSEGRQDVRNGEEWPAVAGEDDRGLFERARKQARRLARLGVRTLAWNGVAPSPDASPACPEVLYGVGAPEAQNRPRAAVFNSRKTKLVSPREPWLRVFREMAGRLERLRPGEFGYVASRGTLTYDLVRAHARRLESPLIEVLPFPIAKTLEAAALDADGEEGNAAWSRRAPSEGDLSGPAHRELLVSCMAGTGGCPVKRAMICRDRLVAFLSDLHMVLEVRAGGNLENVLVGQQIHCPRPQWVFHPGERRGRAAGQAAGNIRLLREFPSWAHPFYEEDPPGDAGSGGKAGSKGDAPEYSPLPSSRERADGYGYEYGRMRGGSALRRPDGSLESDGPGDLEGADSPVGAHAPGSLRVTVLRNEEVAWGEYLYHYTRACPGPWPGQSHEEFLLSLLRGDGLSGHTVLDTLIRIVLEEKIRASLKLVRGEQAVVSWTSRPPMELDSMRRWNRALIRWTFEPFGVAVKRSSLRQMGAKPVIYAPESVYSRLTPSQRFRFQLHRPPRCSWKVEREWRLPRDLLLDRPPVDRNWFLFVPGPADAQRLSGHLGHPPGENGDEPERPIPVVILSETREQLSSDSTDRCVR